MQINHDCIRDLLIVLEQKLNGDIITTSEIAENTLLKSYSQADIFYSSEMLIREGFIIGASFSADNAIEYYGYKSITPEGHKYLDNIRDPKV